MSAESVPFEGVEKRCVIQFAPEVVDLRDSSESKIKSPLSMTTQEWQKLLDEAHCEIISVKELGDHKVYLLSESTLTVWETGFLMKTCGRTTPFLALQALLRDKITAFGPDWVCKGVNWMTYSRLNFLHPRFQIYPHQDFSQELDFIQPLFSSRIQYASLPAGRDTLHIMFYSNGKPASARQFYCMEEVLMSGIDIDCVRALTGHNSQSEYASAGAANTSSIIKSAFANTAAHELDEFWFDPCGYSSNALFRECDSSPTSYFSCHVSPEPVTSYASLELGSLSPSRRPLSTTKGSFSLVPLVAPFKPFRFQVIRMIIRAKGTSKNSVNAVKAEIGEEPIAVSSTCLQASGYSCFVQHIAFESEASLQSSREKLSAAFYLTDAATASNPQDSTATVCAC